MVPPLLGVLLLVCPQGCELPLPASVLEVRTQASHWQWCLRADTAAAWRLCDDEWPAWMRAQLQATLQQLRTTARVPAQT